jgi:hypothetical protein
MIPRAVALSVGVTVLLCLGDARAARADWTLGAFLGGAHTQASSIRLTQPARSTDVTVSPVHYRSESGRPPVYYGYRVGFFPRSRWIGIEGEFIHLKAVADLQRPAAVDGMLRGTPVTGARPLASVLERFSITHGVNLVLVNAVVRRAWGVRASAPSRLFFTGRFGAGASVPHPESTIDGSSLERYEWGSFSAQAAAGVEVQLVKGLYLLGEYKLTRTVQDVSIVDGRIRTPLTTHHVVAGLVAHLGPPGPRRSARRARHAEVPIPGK